MDRSKLIKLTLIVATALALKYHYSTASVNDLRWVLAPTAFAVEFVTGIEFSFESHAGYISEDNSFLIATSCSGLNFLITAFLVLTLARVWRETNVSLWLVPFALLISYLATIVANTVRIVVALYLHDLDYPVLGMDFEELHRIEGILVYFGFLLVLFPIGEYLSAGLSATIGSRSKYLLGVYYGITLGVPLLRGAYREDNFWWHSMVVVLIPLILILPFAALNAVTARRSSNEQLP